MNKADIQSLAEKHGPMLPGVLMGILAAAALLWYWQPAGPTADKLNQQAVVLGQLQQNEARLSKRPLYPPLTKSWSRVLARYSACGLDIRLAENGSRKHVYAGPVAAWRAQVKGPTPRVLSCTLTLPTDVFIRPGAYSVKRGRMTLSLAVLGREGISLAGRPYNVSGDSR